MKQALLSILFLASISVRSQEQISPKPGITVYGNTCLIGNLVYSCTPKTCDSLQIVEGDSIDFCTFQEIYLNTDTAYWMRWHFYGCTNLPDTIWDVYPSQTPICYWPRWDTAGTFIVEIFYNGWLSAYPTSDCYSFGPSHWLIKIEVLPNPNVVDEFSQNDLPCITPNPSDGLFHIQLRDVDSFQSVVITDLTGREILSSSEPQFDLSTFGSGVYFARITCSEGTYSQPVLVH